MTDIKKINIYMGVVGQAYVDKETAKKQMDAALKNVVDVKHIIYLINHSYAEEFAILNDNDNYPLTAQSYIDIAQATLDNANEANQLANTVKSDIENALSSFSEEDQQYKDLQALLNKLAENDIDGLYDNGGNVITAQANVDRINAFTAELNEILSIAQNLLAENQTYYDECVVTYNNAKDVFESYVPEAAEDQASKSDRIEAELIERLKIVAAGLENAQDITNAINQTSNEALAEANEIIQSGGSEPVNPEPEPIEPDPEDPQPGDNGDYYFGVATEDQIMSQSYINSLNYNTSGVKPTELNMSNGNNVFIFPAEWGTPTFTDVTTGFEFGYFTADDLGINNPTGKIIRVYGVSADQSDAYITWS